MLNKLVKGYCISSNEVTWKKLENLKLHCMHAEEEEKLINHMFVHSKLVLKKTYKYNRERFLKSKWFVQKLF